MEPFDAQGKSRPLHIEQALNVIDFARGPIVPLRVAQTAAGAAEVSLVELARCEYFDLQRRTISGAVEVATHNGCLIWLVIEGELQIENDPSGQPLRLGETLFVPAACGAVRATTRGPCIVLEVRLP